MNLEAIVKSFVEHIKPEDIVAVGTSSYDTEFIAKLIREIRLKKINISFIATTNPQATQLHSLGQNVISLSEREIDIAIEFVDQVDQYNNFVKKDTRSFIRDKMISQSALKLVVVCNKSDVITSIDKDVYVEISSFAWQRTLLNLQSYGNARMVIDADEKFVKTEIGHYIVRITLDSNISLEDFEYSVRNIPGVLETGVFLGLVDVLFVIDYNDNNYLEIKNRI